MVSKSIITRYIIALIGIFFSCAAMTSGQVSTSSPAVLIVKSSFRTEYEQAIDTLKASLPDSYIISEDTFTPETDADFWDRIYRNQPDVIITVGTSATSSAITYARQIPIFYTMVLNHFTDNNSPATRNNKISGITLSIPVRIQLDLIREAVPFARRVGGLYSKSSIGMHQSAQLIAEDLGLQLVTREITNERDIDNRLMEILPQIDIFWMPPDAMIYSDLNILGLILRECYKNSVPIIAVSKHLAVAGTPLALGVDFQDIGKQTAELVIKTLSAGNASVNKVEAPRKVDMYINRRVVSGLGLEIPNKVLERAIPVESEQ